MWESDVFFNCKLRGFDDKIHSVFNSNGKVEGQEVASKFSTVHSGSVAGDDATQGCWDANGSDLVRIILVFVEAEEICVVEVGLHARVYVAIEDVLKEMANGFVVGRIVLFGYADEYVLGIHKEAIGFASRETDNGFDDVTWHVEGCGGSGVGGGIGRRLLIG